MNKAAELAAKAMAIQTCWLIIYVNFQFQKAGS